MALVGDTALSHHSLTQALDPDWDQLLTCIGGDILAVSGQPTRSPPHASWVNTWNIHVGLER